ncbi:MAG: Asp-tRNA(Asn)/Glu-tRNA(Gln) amidotransferase subunit GatA [bacterium]
MQNLTIEKAQAMMNNGELTSEKLVNYYIENIKSKNEVNAFLEVFDDAIEMAKLADKERASSNDKVALLKQKPLLGIPCAVKDNIVIAGKISSASSKILEKYVAPHNAAVIIKVRDAGAIFIGRTNMDEFAMGGSTENSAFGVTKNPIDLTRVAGGSSGGSAAAVAMDGALIALGSDTGGSIRQPASYCGVVGLKPTYGAVSRHGLMAMGSSLDVIGPLTNSVRDAEIVFDVIKGDEKTGSVHDSNALTNFEYEKHRNEKDRSKIKIGIIPELFNIGGIDEEVIKNFNNSIEKFKNAGYEIMDVSLPLLKYSLAVYYVVMPAEVSSNMARFDGVKFGSKSEGANLLEDYLKTRGDLLGKEVRRRIMLGTYVLSSGYHDAYYNKANSVRDLLREDFKKAFEKVDVILTPTAPSPAFKIGQNSDDPIKMYLEDIFTVTANLVGIPAISIPSGKSDGLPLGLQFMAPHCREDVLFAIGKKFEDIV